MVIDYLTAFTTGLLGGFGHCIGMCGPIIGSYAVSSAPSLSLRERLFSHLLYNTGRITTYAFVGFLMGLAGSSLSGALRTSGIQQAIAFMAGVVMIIMGLGVSGFIKRPFWLEDKEAHILRAGKVFMTEASIWRYYLLGAVFGLLPCGLSYSMFVAASGTGNPMRGLMLTLLFGIGSMPALLLFGYGASLFGSGMRGMLYRASGVVIVFMGIMYIKRAILS
jgi:hypothetical protein